MVAAIVRAVASAKKLPRNFKELANFFHQTMIHMTERNESCKPISYTRDRGLQSDIMTATISGSMSEGNWYHQRLAVYPIVPISAARQTGISPPTMMVKPNTVIPIILIRIERGRLRINSERNMMSIMIFPPLTTMICISPEALSCSLSSVSMAVLCPKRIPERMVYPDGGNIVLSRASSHF